MYLVVGALTIGAATGMGGRTTDPPGALQTISGAKPFGWIVLWFVTVGLGAYALRRLVQAVADPEGESRDTSGIASRVGARGSCVGLLGVCVHRCAVGRYLRRRQLS